MLRDGKCFSMQMGGGGLGMVWHAQHPPPPPPPPELATEHAGPVAGARK